jgi:SAM-dependent methyltransferase
MLKVIKKVALCVPQIKKVVSERDILKVENNSLKNEVDTLKLEINYLKGLDDPKNWTRSRQRWINENPNASLTWGYQLNGDKFIEKIISYNSLQTERNILEIGPGYGRLLESLLKFNTKFKKYTGVDISNNNINYLKNTFKDNNISFILGDFENIGLEDRFDIVISSLTFKHLYPSFEKLLSNVYKHLTPGGWIFFDLIESGVPNSFFENGGVTYIRHYSKQEIDEILHHTSFKLVNYDNVIHDNEHSRLLVVARK